MALIPQFMSADETLVIGKVVGILRTGLSAFSPEKGPGPLNVFPSRVPSTQPSVSVTNEAIPTDNAPETKPCAVTSTRWIKKKRDPRTMRRKFIVK